VRNRCATGAQPVRVRGVSAHSARQTCAIWPVAIQHVALHNVPASLSAYQRRAPPSKVRREWVGHYDSEELLEAGISRIEGKCDMPHLCAKSP
jgi:hypothetical protein